MIDSTIKSNIIKWSNKVGWIDNNIIYIYHQFFQLAEERRLSGLENTFSICLGCLMSNSSPLRTGFGKLID